MLDLENVLKQGLQDAQAGWNMGSFGAIAEFHHVGDELPPPLAAPLTQVTHRGGLRIERLSDVRPVAYETLSPRAHRWSQAVSLCLPEAQAMMHRRAVLTEIGPDGPRCGRRTAPPSCLTWGWRNRRSISASAPLIPNCWTFCARTQAGR